MKIECMARLLGGTGGVLLSNRAAVLAPVLPLILLGSSGAGSLALHATRGQGRAGTGHTSGRHVGAGRHGRGVGEKSWQGE